MNEWCVQFRQRFNGHASQCKVYVNGYVNAMVNGIWRCRRERGDLCHED